MTDWNSFWNGVLMVLAIELILLGITMVIREAYSLGFKEGRASR